MSDRQPPGAKAADALVVVERGTAVTTTEVIAHAAGVQHKNVLALVRMHLADFMEFGQVAFETRLNSQGSPTEYAILNEHQTALLFTYMRNTLAVRMVKMQLVREFFRVTSELQRLKSMHAAPEWKSARLEAGRGYSFMSMVIHETRGGTDRPATSLTYVNEARVINYAMTGSHREKFDREAASSAELRLLERVETKNAILFARGVARKDRELSLRLMVMSERGLLPPPQPAASRCIITGKAR